MIAFKNHTVFRYLLILCVKKLLCLPAPNPGGLGSGGACRQGLMMGRKSQTPQRLIGDGAPQELSSPLKEEALQ